MNPWSLYEHQPQLFQAGVVAIGTWRLVRRPTTPSGHARIAAICALSWAAVGVVDYLVYAFGYQAAGLSIGETEPIQEVLEWLRVLLAVAGVLALRAAVPREPSPRPG